MFIFGNQLAVARTSGFTIVELLVSMAVMVILATLTVTTFKDYADRSQLQGEVVGVTRDLMEQRSKTLAALNDSVYGFAVSSTSLIYFAGSTYVPGAAGNEVVPLNYTTATSSFSNGLSYIVFSKITGEASATGTIELISGAQNSTTTITIHGSGLIE